MADSPQAIKKSIRLYLLVGLLLFIFTGVTYAVATVPWLDVGGHGFDMYDCILGLSIALFKSTLVAMIFMHLNHEKKAVYWIFSVGLIMASALGGLTAFAEGDPIWDTFFYSGDGTAELEISQDAASIP